MKTVGGLVISRPDEFYVEDGPCSDALEMILDAHDLIESRIEEQGAIEAQPWMRKAMSDA